jgi:hypothetical protein
MVGGLMIDVTVHVGSQAYKADVESEAKALEMVAKWTGDYQDYTEAVALRWEHRYATIYSFVRWSDITAIVYEVVKPE